MDTMIKLYRGDFQEIDEFKFTKTSKGCLVGQGIYLTSKVEVANTYRNKGIYYSRSRGYSPPPALCGVVTLYQGPLEKAKNRNEAYVFAFKEFCRLIEYDRRVPQDFSAERKKQWLRDEFDRLKESRQITSEYEGVYKNKGIYVKWDTGRWIGHLSNFMFTERELKLHMLHVNKPVFDKGIIELFWDHKLADRVFTPYNDKETFIRNNYGACIMPLNKDTVQIQRKRLPWADIRRVLEPWGYRGFEYNGGAYIGGCGMHRAFCVWDDAWVNQHRST